jgi:hypothetical protein
MTTESTADSNGSGLPPLEHDHPLLEALREALAEILAEQQHRWKRERALIEAQAAAVVADMRAAIVTLNGKFDRMIAERLSSLRDGEPGALGPKGEPGPPGRDGRLRKVTDWSDGVHYEGDLVHHGGSLWQCIKDSGRHRHTRIGCVSSAPAVTAARRGFVARGPRMANTARLMSVPWAAARSSRPRTIPVFVQGMDGRLSRCPASAGSRGLVGSAARRVRGDRRVSRRRLSSAGLSTRRATAWFLSCPTVPRGPASN